jgi:cyclomaltodextrinase
MIKRFSLFSFFLAFLFFSLSAQSSDVARERELSAADARPSFDWVRTGIIYEIYPRSFSPEGNFTGIEKGLPALKGLGVSILWLMPIHPVGIERRKGTLGSPYSIQDYYGINPEFGTLDDFRRLVRRAHEMDFHIIIDLVANHTSWDSKLIREHPEWFTKDSTGKIISPNRDWHDVADLNYSQPGLRGYMIEMMKYWVRDIGIDGFRCDVSEMVPTDFWESARAALDSIKPVMMLSEGSYPEHHLKAFDLTYSWNLYGALAPIMSGQKTAREIDRILSTEEIQFPHNSLRLRFSSNHDETAWDKPDVEKFGRSGAKLAAVIVNTLPGVPLLYNGQEVGNPKKLGLFEKDLIDWSTGKEVTDFYKKLFSVRRTHPALSVGSMFKLKTSQDRSVYAFARISGNDTVLVAYNFSQETFRGGLTLWLFGFRVSETAQFTDLFTDKIISFDREAKALFIELPPMGYGIWSVH